MEESRLRLVRAPASGAESPRRRLRVVLLGLLPLLGAVWATVGGADRARRPVAARELAHDALHRSLERGNADAGVRGVAQELRRVLARRPLDGRARVAYAGLLLGLSRSLADTRAAVFHAGLAAELSPVTVPVVHSATLVLARAAERDRAVDLIRSMFLYAPESAAELLFEIHESLFDEELDRALPDDPEASLAWIARLREEGRTAQADAWLAATFERWPGRLSVQTRTAHRALVRGDWDTLAAVFPEDSTLPDTTEAASALAYRARANAARGAPEEARSDLRRALALDDSAALQVLAGDGYEALGDGERAAELWNGALFRIAARARRESVLVRLARLEDREGEPAVALRLWRSVLDISPAHAEARARVDELTGFRR